MRVAGGVLPKAALRHLRTKRRRPSGHWTDVWREEHAVAFTVAQMTQDALLAETHAALQQALRDGETFESFRAGLEPWLERRGWAPKGRGGDIPTRLRRIYSTNLRTARAAGQWDRISRNAELLPYLVYELGPSEEHRVEHVAWAGLCLPVGHEWWNTHYPPNGWGCKCRVRQVAEPPEGAATTAPDVEYREWVNPATGEVREVAAGIDAGWDYHVGARRTAGVHAAWLERCERAAGARGPASAARMIGRWLAGPGFEWFVRRPRAREKARWEARPALVEAVPVGVLSAAAAAAMGAPSRVVRLTEKVMHKQAVRHPEVLLDLYRRLPEVLSAAAPVEVAGAASGRRWMFRLELARARSLQLIVEVPHDGGAPLVVSTHKRRKDG